MKSTGEIIKVRRVEKGLTQEQLGRALFVSKQAVSKWENNITLPDLDMIRRICDVLDIRAAEILQRIGDDPRAHLESLKTAQEGSVTKDTRIEAWQDFKFGMFIHYGVYSKINRSGAEWVMFLEPIDVDDYAAEAQSFTAENFSGEYYAKLARRAGMKYMVMTARHHDGFCLFDSTHSYRNFTVMNTPVKRDLIREYTEACRHEGLGVGLYYSAMDWRFEGYFLPKMYRKSAMAMREQCHKQVRELAENYGKLDILWYDGGEDWWLAHSINFHTLTPSADDEKSYKSKPPIENFWGEQELDTTVRALQPQIVINNRLGECKYGDYTTPERIVGSFDTEHPWETCDTLSETWGYRSGKKILSLERVIHMLIETVTGGGNLLLNVSPKGDGSLEPAHEERLLEVGRWLDLYGDAIYATRGGPIRNNKERGGFTWRENSLFCFLKSDVTGEVIIPVFGGKLESVTSLTGEKVICSPRGNGTVALSFEEQRADIVSIACLKFNENVGKIYANRGVESFDAFENCD